MEIFITIIIVAFAGYSLYKSLKKSAKGGCSSCSSDNNCSSKGSCCSSIKKEDSEPIKFAK